VWCREGVWSGIVAIPRDCEVKYRYFVGIAFEPDEEKFTSRRVIVQRWETNLNPRLVYKDGMCLSYLILLLLLYVNV
jgi:hypothetical protein